MCMYIGAVRSFMYGMVHSGRQLSILTSLNSYILTCGSATLDWTIKTKDGMFSVTRMPVDVFGYVRVHVDMHAYTAQKRVMSVPEKTR